MPTHKRRTVQPRKAAVSPADHYVSALQECYCAEHVLLERLPTLARAVAAPALRRLLKQCQRWTVLRISRLLPVLDAGGPIQRSPSQSFERLFTQVRAILRRAAMGSSDKDAALMAILREVHASQRQAYGALQHAAEVQGDARGAQLFHELGDELAEAIRLAEEAVAGGATGNGSEPQARPARTR
jgi:ferritin-like metal-binding protein YciE